jgi:polygalacturonase
MQSLTISNARNVVVEGVRSVSSELFHVVVLQSRGVTVRRVTVEAPADSPNTDGIHIHKSTNVAVYDAAIRTGDDCVSVGPGNSNLWIERVACGPGHGIRYVRPYGSMHGGNMIFFPINRVTNQLMIF